MSTNVATREEVEGQTKALATKNDDAPVDPAFETAKRQAIALSSSDLVPKDFRGNVANCLLALELANRMHCPPMMVMQNLHVVQGKPGFSGSFLIGVVNQSEEFTRLRYRFEGEPGTPAYGCRAIAQDAETGEELVGTLVTMQMATDEKWGAKWRTMPEQMLRYRSAAFWARAYAPHLTMGMNFVDELQDVSATPALESATVDLNAALEDLEDGAADEVVDAEVVTDEPTDLFTEDA